MPVFDPSTSVQSPDLPQAPGPISPGDYTALPLPEPSSDPSATGGLSGKDRVVQGGDGDDRLLVPAGGVANGGAGDDTFVIIADGRDSADPLATLVDVQAGDTFDLSQLGAAARELGRTALAGPGGGERVGLDFDGDGDEDGYLLVFHHQASDLAGYEPYPMPTVDSSTFGDDPQMGAGVAGSSLGWGGDLWG